MVLTLKMNKGVPSGTPSDKPEQKDESLKQASQTTTSEIQDKQKLKLRAHESNEGKRSVHDGPQVLSGNTYLEKRDVTQKKGRKEAQENKESSKLELFILSAVTFPLTYFLYVQSQGEVAQHMEWYTTARMYILPVAWLLIVIEAFKFTRISGVLSVLFPPFWAYFLLTNVDYKILRGTVTGILLVLVMELAFIPEYAFFNDAQASFSHLVKKSQNILNDESLYDVR